MRVLLLARSATAAQPLREMEHWASVMAALPGVSAAIFAFSEEGEVFVMKSTPDLETVAEISMGEPIYATPAVSNGTIYLRTWKRLYAIGG